MTVVICTFTGWVQIRLATNPDPPDEHRGVSGYTFALPGEADLDRQLRTSDPVAPRSHGPAIGVFVDSVTVDGIAVPGHHLVGAQLDLVTAPIFESVNDVVMTQGVEALEPFELVLHRARFRLRRRDYLEPDHPDATVYTVPPALLQARRLAIFEYDDSIMRQATGGGDAVAFRHARLLTLQADLAQATDPYQRAGLFRRISELEIVDPQDHRTTSMHFIEHRTYTPNGPTELTDPDGWLPGLDTSAPFAVTFTMGSWDCDALSAYALGTLTLTLR